MPIGLTQASELQTQYDPSQQTRPKTLIRSSRDSQKLTIFLIVLAIFSIRLVHLLIVTVVFDS